MSIKYDPTASGFDGQRQFTSDNTPPAPLVKYSPRTIESGSTKDWYTSMCPDPNGDWCKAEDVARRDEDIIRFLKDFIEWNACVAKDYDKSIYICDQCHNHYNQDGTGCQHEEGCLIVEAQRLLVQVGKKG